MTDTTEEIDTDELRERYARHFYNNDGTPAAKDFLSMSDTPLRYGDMAIKRLMRNGDERHHAASPEPHPAGEVLVRDVAAALDVSSVAWETHHEELTTAIHNAITAWAEQHGISPTAWRERLTPEAIKKWFTELSQRADGEQSQK